LLTLGHRQIAALLGRKELFSTQLRLTGIRKALAEAGLPEPLIRYSQWKPGDDPHSEGRRYAIELLHVPNPPTAFFTLSQRLLEGNILAIRELGLRCPDD